MCYKCKTTDIGMLLNRFNQVTVHSDTSQNIDMKKDIA